MCVCLSGFFLLLLLFFFFFFFRCVCVCVCLVVVFVLLFSGLFGVVLYVCFCCCLFVLGFCISLQLLQQHFALPVDV